MTKDQHNAKGTGDGWTIPLSAIDAAGHQLEKTITAAWLTEALGPTSIYRADGGPVVGRARLRLMLVAGDDAAAGEAVHVRGDLDLKLRAECSRCLGPVALALQLELELVMVPEASLPQAKDDDEVDQGADELGMATYRGQEVQLSPVVRDELLLQLPMTPVCTRECAGLCGQCGENLNAGACACEAPTDHRWSALKKIKLPN